MGQSAALREYARLLWRHSIAAHQAPELANKASAPERPNRLWIGSCAILHATLPALLSARSGAGWPVGSEAARRQTEHRMLAAFLQALGSRRRAPRPRAGDPAGRNQRSTLTSAVAAMPLKEARRFRPELAVQHSLASTRTDVAAEGGVALRHVSDLAARIPGTIAVASAGRFGAPSRWRPSDQGITRTGLPAQVLSHATDHADEVAGTIAFPSRDVDAPVIASATIAHRPPGNHGGGSTLCLRLPASVWAPRTCPVAR